MLTLSLGRLVAAPGPRVVVPRCRRRCFSAAAAAATTAYPRWLPPQAPLLRLGPLAGCCRHQVRGLATMDGLRALFLEGPEAAGSPSADVGATAAASPLPPAADEAAASFFVQDAPAAIQELLEGAEQLVTSAAEPTFASLELGTGFWPSNMPLKLLELMHVSLDAPWWLCAIGIGIGVRIIMLLPNMQLQRMIRVDLPKMLAIREFTNLAKFASRSGNIPETMRLQQLALEQFPELIDPSGGRKMIRRMVLTAFSNLFAMNFVQYASIRAIYRATALPVESFQQGGLLWVMDLTCIDPYFVLPAAITTLLMLNVRFYFKNVTMASEQIRILKPLAYTLLPTFVFTCLLNFAGANLFYFLATGCTAQLLHRINSTEAGKAFWMARIGLPRVADLPPPVASLQGSAASERIRSRILPALNSRDLESSRLSADAGVPKTFRIRQGN